jgi:hypothetical protein
MRSGLTRSSRRSASAQAAALVSRLSTCSRMPNASSRPASAARWRIRVSRSALRASEFLAAVSAAG